MPPRTFGPGPIMSTCVASPWRLLSVQSGCLSCTSRSNARYASDRRKSEIRIVVTKCDPASSLPCKVGDAMRADHRLQNAMFSYHPPELKISDARFEEIIVFPV